MTARRLEKTEKAARYALKHGCPKAAAKYELHLRTVQRAVAALGKNKPAGRPGREKTPDAVAMALSTGDVKAAAAHYGLHVQTVKRAIKRTLKPGQACIVADSGKGSMLTTIPFVGAPQRIICATPEWLLARSQLAAKLKAKGKP